MHALQRLLTSRARLSRRLLSAQLSVPSKSYRNKDTARHIGTLPRRGDRGVKGKEHSKAFTTMASTQDASNNRVSLKNRCGESKSPYVRSHIDNPTAWQLWTPETLELAKKTNRLLFVR